MRNYWLQKRDWLTEIVQVGDYDDNFRNKWYVHGYFKKDLEEYQKAFREEWHGQQIASLSVDCPYLYLHKDGTWYEVLMKDNEWTGYYDTKEEAEQVLRDSVVPV